MGWVYRDVDRHRCDKPDYEPKIKTGDIWQCDECKKKYKVTSVKAGTFDQRDGWYGGQVNWAEITIPYSDWRD